MVAGICVGTSQPEARFDQKSADRRRSPRGLGSEALPTLRQAKARSATKRFCSVSAAAKQDKGLNDVFNGAAGRVEQNGAMASTNPYSESKEVLIEFENVHKSFGSKSILRGASFRIYRGEAVGIIGASGTGKSTALRLAAGLLAPDKGKIFIKGKERSGLLADGADDEHLKIGMVFQSGALFDSLTVGENVGFLLYEHSNLPDSRIKELVAQSLGTVGLTGVEDLYPSQLSGGMRKRVALARAVVMDDDNDKMEQILMYDEPTAGLDPVASTVIEDLMRNLHEPPSNGNQNSRGGGFSSYIVVTHQHSTIKRAVDRLIFLHDGKVVWQGSTKEFDTTQEAIVRQFATGSLEGPIQYV
ncbi:hypothetical protein BSKO_01327 [Bryopsis sp. KO-2023]|nr:hypothetical protein BSKO_01327 [Bryopsis sp. KO-2023]